MIFIIDLFFATDITTNKEICGSITHTKRDRNRQKWANGTNEK